MVLNSQNRKIYTPQTPPGKFTAPTGPPAAKALALPMSAFVAKLNLYLKTATAKIARIKACHYTL